MPPPNSDIAETMLTNLPAGRDNLSGLTRLANRGTRLVTRWAWPIKSCLNLMMYHWASKQGSPTDPVSQTANAGAVWRVGGSLD